MEKKTSAGTYDKDYNRGKDVFVAKYDKNLINLIASTYIGGTGDDSSRSISIDKSGNVCIWGNITSQDFPLESFIYSFVKLIWGIFISVQMRTQVVRKWTYSVK